MLGSEKLSGDFEQWLRNWAAVEGVGGSWCTAGTSSTPGCLVEGKLFYREGVLRMVRPDRQPMAPSIMPRLANQLAARSGRVPDAARVCVRDDVRRLETGALASAVLYTGTSQLFLLVTGNLGGTAQSVVLSFKIRPFAVNS